jgi:hypothetical protein
MNHRYRKRPIEVEAFHMTPERRWDNSEWPHWLHVAWQQGARGGGLWCENGGEDLLLGTLEGAYTLRLPCWIIRGVKGELYPCDEEVFALTYEPVDAGLEGEKP